MKIKELEVGMNNVNLIATVTNLAQPRQVMTKFGSETSLIEATLQDDSGSIKLTLWGKQAEGIEEGAEVEVKGGFVKEWREELQLGIGRSGDIKVVKKTE